MLHPFEQGEEDDREWSWEEDLAILTSHATVEASKTKQEFWKQVFDGFKESTEGTTARYGIQLAEMVLSNSGAIVVGQ